MKCWIDCPEMSKLEALENKCSPIYLKEVKFIEFLGEEAEQCGKEEI